MEYLQTILEILRLLSYVIIVLGSAYLLYTSFKNNSKAVFFYIGSIGAYFTVSLLIVLFRIYNLLHYIEYLVLWGYTPTIILFAIATILYIAHLYE